MYGKNQKEAIDRYRKTDKGKEATKKANLKYQQSDDYKEYKKEYNRQRYLRLKKQNQSKDKALK